MFHTPLTNLALRSHLWFHIPTNQSPLRTPPSPLSSRPERRDLQFNGLVLEMFFHTEQPSLKGTGFSPYKTTTINNGFSH